MKITEMLKGCEPGKIQSVGYMQIVPLISKYVDDTIFPPTIKASTTDYGRLVITNDTVNDVLVPTGAAIVSKQRAQDHATHKGAFLKKNTTVKIDTAACIQDSQGGYLNSDNGYHLSVLPWGIREQAYNVRDRQAYDKLWPVLRQFNSNLGILHDQGHLSAYLDKFEEDMNQFIAEFELVPNMVGAIVLINGMVIGVERCPNYQYWEHMWEPLIRESYGSAVFQFVSQTKERKNIPKPITRVPLSDSRIKTLDDLEKEFDRVTSEEDKVVTQIIQSFLKTKFKTDSEQKVGKTEMVSVKNDQFLGQAFTKDGNVLYCSLVTTQDFMKKPRRNIRRASPDWDDAKEFSM